MLPENQAVIKGWFGLMSKVLEPGKTEGEIFLDTG